MFFIYEILLKKTCVKPLDSSRSKQTKGIYFISEIRDALIHSFSSAKFKAKQVRTMGLAHAQHTPSQGQLPKYGV
jgi:hypothetical protein